MTDSLHDVADIAALADEVRRELYLYVSAQESPVSRDQAAAALDLPRHQAAFGLDRLESAGLLQTDYVRLSGRTGPGAGRPSKVYRRADREISVSLPDRDYVLAGELMAQAITTATRDQVPVHTALAEVAADRGRQIGRQASGAGGHPHAIATAALVRYGYEPRDDGADIVLINCPFHSLAQEHPDLVCGMNESLLSGMCDSIGGMSAHLEPGERRCCVVLRARPTGTAPDD